MAATTNPLPESVRHAEHYDLRLAVLELARALSSVAQAVDDLADYSLAHSKDPGTRERFSAVQKELVGAQEHLMRSLSIFSDGSDGQR